MTRIASQVWKTGLEQARAKQGAVPG